MLGGAVFSLKLVLASTRERRSCIFMNALSGSTLEPSRGLLWDAKAPLGGLLGAIGDLLDTLGVTAGSLLALKR